MCHMPYGPCNSPKAYNTSMATRATMMMMSWWSYFDEEIYDAPRGPRNIPIRRGNLEDGDDWKFNDPGESVY